MVLQKAMKQGRNVHGIPLLDACSDHNITSRMCGHVGGHAYSVSFSKWLLDWHIQYPNLEHISIICRVQIRGWDSSVQQNMLASWRLYSHSHLLCFLVQFIWCAQAEPTVSSMHTQLKTMGELLELNGVGMPPNVATHP